METLKQSVKRVVVWQGAGALLLMAGVVLVAAWAGAEAVRTVGLVRAQSVGFGALLGILATVVTARNVGAAARVAADHPYLGLLPVYFGVMWKLVIVAGGAYTGLAHLGMAPLPMMLGYLVTQAGYLAAGWGDHRGDHRGA